MADGLPGAEPPPHEAQKSLVSISEKPRDAQSPSRRRYRVGYALAPKKQKSFIRPSLISMASARSIDLVSIDPLTPLAAQGPFDLVLHKISSPEWEAQLHEFSLMHPSVPIIDPPHAIERLHNRISMLQVVADLNAAPVAENTFGIPKQVVIYDLDSLSDATCIDGLHFPLIAKPLIADGSAKSHKMSLVFNPENLLKIKPPIVLQEFVNHGGVIFKVYVVGDYVQCVKRKSLRDLPEDYGHDRPVGPVSFSQVSNVSAQAGVLDSSDSQQIEEATMPPIEFLKKIAEGLRHALGLQLFNFDVIRDTKMGGNHYLVVDINYFPGYAKMPSYESALTDFLWNAVQKTKNGDEVDKHGSNSTKVEKDCPRP